MQKYNKHALRSDGEKDQNKGGTLLQPVSVIARDFYTPWYKTVLRAFTPSQGTAGQRSFVPVRTAARPMDLIAWKRVLDGRTMSGYSNCIEYLIERQSTFAMWKFAACVSELLVFRR